MAACKQLFHSATFELLRDLAKLPFRWKKRFLLRDESFETFEMLTSSVTKLFFIKKDKNKMIAMLLLPPHYYILKNGKKRHEIWNPFHNRFTHKIARFGKLLMFVRSNFENHLKSSSLARGTVFVFHCCVLSMIQATIGLFLQLLIWYGFFCRILRGGRHFRSLHKKRSSTAV